MKKDLWYWTVPPGWYELGRGPFLWLRKRRALRLCRGNSRYRGIHQGKRCFIVGNGPSIQKQNLLPLKNEIVFSVSSGYHHKDYASYKPQYHCVPQLTYSEKITRPVAIAWFQEMHEKLGDAELFLDYHEEPLVRENQLFPGRKVSYLCMHGEFGPHSDRQLSLTGVVPAVGSVPIMCIMIALYMGFREIYLLGIDHDSFRTREYKYFFKPTLLAGKMGGVTDNDTVSDPVREELFEYYRLFNQYRALRQIAGRRGVNVYNATAGGALDELERVRLEDVLNAG
jgi:hypothetical protein